MMVQEHPTPELLTAFGLGKLGDAESMALEAHLAECETCRQALETQAADSFVALARAVRADRTCPDVPGPVASPGAPTCAHTDAEAPASTEAPPELADHPRYRILGLIGVGGMGAVFKAEHLLMHRIVALKVINRRLVASSSMVERFSREVSAAGNLLSHPNIVHYYDADHVGDTHFLVMEYVEGTTLAKMIAETGALPIAQACDFIRQAALGLQYAFERGMTHRDIKPQNLMVSGEGRGARGEKDSSLASRPSSLVKILDFGLARLAQETAPTPMAETVADQANATPSGTLTQIGTVMGTPDYIAPEQARDAHAADIRSDIYSLGCTLYDLLTGKPPFPHGTVMQKVIAHLEQTPRPVTELRADVPAELARVVEKMLAKDPAERYQTPAEVAMALAPFVSEPEASAKVAASLAHASGSDKRRRWGWIAAAFGICCFLGFFLPPVQEFGQTVIRIATNKGVLEIEADDQDLDITIKQPGKEPRIEFIDKRTKKQFVLTAVGGEITFQEKGGDLRLTTTNFELARNGRKYLSAHLLLGEVKSDRDLIQGTWRPVRVEVSGLPVPDLVFQTLNPHVTITGERIVWKIGPDMLLPNLEGEIVLDPRKSPKTINMIVFDTAKKERKVLLGIYRLDGDTLEICSAVNPDKPADRPKEFKSEAKGFVGHITLQRVKAGANAKGDAFQPLLNGKDLTGWEGDKVFHWRWKDGQLLGSSGNGDTHTFAVWTQRRFKDFELKFQAKLQDGQGQARVGFRNTLLVREGESPRPIGPSIALGKDVWGNLLNPPFLLAPAKRLGNAVKQDDFNDFLIRYVDRKVTVQINGVIVVDGVFSELARDAEGVIAFEVTQGIATEVFLRNLEIRELPGLAPAPKELAFQPLFDGKDASAWDLERATTWRFEDNRLICRGNGGLLQAKNLKLHEFHLRVEARTFGDGAYLRLGPQLYKTPTQKSVIAHQHVMLFANGAVAAGTIGMEFNGNNFTGETLKDRTKAGEWFTLEVIHEGRYVRTLINGEPAAEFVNTEPAALIGLGLLGFHVEAKNGELQIRKVEIKELAATPAVDAKRIQGAWTAYQGGLGGNNAKSDKEDLKKFALKFDGDKLASSLFPNATFQMSGKDRISIQWLGPNQQIKSVQGTYRLQHDLLSLDFQEVELKDRKKQPLQIALMRFHDELRPLFNGKNLDRFANDSKAWTWRDSKLIGVQRADEFVEHWLWRPSFGDLGDFELEFDARLEGQAPVAVLFRGGENPERSGLKMNGPMLTVGGKTPGGLWSKQLKQMLKTPAPDIIKNVRENEFNHYLLRCVGKRVTVQVNGVTTVDDEIDAPRMQPVGNLGWVLLGDGKAGTVTFRDIKIRDLPAPESAVQPLFNGKDLDGWNPWADAPGGGVNDWTVADNLLVFGKPDQYLHGIWSTKRFKDFELKFQAKLDGSNGEADFRVRTDPLPDHPLRQPRGITLALRQGTGSWAVAINGLSRSESKILAEGTKGNGLIDWNGYNDFVVRCMGNHVTVQINGKKVVDQVVDEKLHAALVQQPLPRNGHVTVHFKPGDAKLLIRDLAIRELPPPPEDRGFVPLVSGKNLDAWKGPSDSYFVKKDGSLLANPVGNEYAMLQTIKSYENYELRLQYKLPNEEQAGAKNRAGIALHVSNPPELSTPRYAIAINFTSGRAPDMRVSGSGKLGVVKSSQLSRGPTGAGSWRDLRVVCQDKKVTVYCNGEERWSCTECPVSKGQIGLWAVDGEAYFRDIEIRELPPPADAVRLQGQWSLSLAESEGKRLPIDGNDLKNMEIHFGATEFEMIAPAPGPGQELIRVKGTYTLDPVKKEIKLKFKELKTPEPVPCSYLLDGDRLTLDMKAFTLSDPPIPEPPSMRFIYMRKAGK